LRAAPPFGVPKGWQDADGAAIFSSSCHSESSQSGGGVKTTGQTGRYQFPFLKKLENFLSVSGSSGFSPVFLGIEISNMTLHIHDNRLRLTRYFG